MSCRSWLLCLAALLVFAVQSLVFTATLPGRRIKPEAFEQIQRGMSREEVLAVLGPPRDFTVFREDVDFGPAPELSEDGYCEHWASDAGSVRVTFIAGGVTEVVSYGPGAPRDAVGVLKRVVGLR